MGSAQSARRIQPGGARPAVPRRADLSRSPFLPTPPPARRPSPLLAGGWAAARGRGRGWGRRGTAPRPATGRRRAHFHRRRCAATGSGTAGKARRGRWLGGDGGRPPGWSPSHPSRVLQPPGSSSSPNPGAEETGSPVAALSSLVWRPGRPSHGATALPPPPLLGGPGVGADCPQCAPGVVAPSGRGGSVGHAALSPSRGRSRAHGVGGDVGYPPDPS